MAFATAHEWVGRLASAKRAGTVDEEFERLGRIALLIVDEVGRILFEREAAALFFALGGGHRGLAPAVRRRARLPRERVHPHQRDAGDERRLERERAHVLRLQVVDVRLAAGAG